MLTRRTFLTGLALSAPVTAHAHDNRYPAYVVSVYDGDTITVDIDQGLGGVRTGEKLRLYGIDAPEMYGPERPLGIIARDWLRDQILGRSIEIETLDDDRGKYGRLLAVIWIDGRNINAELVERGLAEAREY